MRMLLFSSLRFYWKSFAGVLLGTMLSAAILTGSLLVGDSVDGSLRTFALQRLGNVHSAMYTPNRFFSSGLAGKISGDAVAVLQLRGMAMTDDRQVNRVQVIGGGTQLWTFAGMEFQLLDNEVALNEKLAASLGVKEGDDVSLRIEKPGLLPRDAPLASRNDDRTVRGRYTVKRILADDELGRFSLSANQVVPYNAFVNLAGLAERTELIGKSNLILAGNGNPEAAMKEVWSLSDFGLGFRAENGVVQLESEQIYLGPEAVRAALTIPEAQGTLTYLVNSLSKGTASTPYSFVIAHAGAELGKDEIVINQWLADELGAGIGDEVTMKYFELLPSNAFEERERAFVVRNIAAMETLEIERQLAPRFPGLTDVDRCADWDAGIPMEEEQLEDEANEEYWNQYKQTPKVVVSLKAGQEMWSNRFGSLTSVRWMSGRDIEPAFQSEFDPVAAGFIFQPVRAQALAAVNNAMDFGQLFVGMSFFLIVAALMLVGLLFVFIVQQRAEEMGILLATGWRPGAVRRLLLLEGAAIALVGSVAGAWLGTGYTRLLILGLSRYWEGAIANSAIQYFATPGTIAIGVLASFVCAVLAMSIAIWRQAKHPARELLMADFSQELNIPVSQTNRLSYLSVGTAVGAVGIVIFSLVADAQSVTMPFFGAGALLLVSGVLFCADLFRRMGRRENMPCILGMALRNAARRRARSLTVVGLLASGCFLVFAVSSMKEDVAAHADQPGSGTGGFAWFGESTLPITDDLGGVRLRVRDGDDASCLNLNRAQSPRLLGVDPDAMSQRQAFVSDEDVWDLLNTELPEGMVPALVGDADTAMWGLEAKTGIEKGAVLDYVDGAGYSFQVKLVGALPMRLSVFQGTLLIAEQDFVARFPSEAGYRMFLMDEPAGNRRYERAGLDVVPSVERLLEFYVVETTYLSMFLVLGALGLAVGSLGMGVVVLRNVQDRRSETALLRAIGYRDTTLRKMLFMEHGLLMTAGLLIGTVSAAVAMVPALFLSHSLPPYNLLFGLLALVIVSGGLCMFVMIQSSMNVDILRGLRNE